MGKQEIGTLEDLAATVIAYLERTPERPARGSGRAQHRGGRARTGIGADTLRKWERRYGVLRPNRTTGGQRRYDERDVARVEWLRDRLADGFRIGEAAALLADDAATTTSSTSGLRDAIVAAVSDSDPRQLTALVEQAFTLHDVETAVEEIVAPALRTVGDRWANGAECIAEEHLLSEAVRSRLRVLLADRRHAVRGTAVLACAPGERHELGLLALAVLLQADGWLAVYLGADAPLESSLALAGRMGAGVALPQCVDPRPARRPAGPARGRPASGDHAGDRGRRRRGAPAAARRGRRRPAAAPEPDQATRVSACLPTYIAASAAASNPSASRESVG